MGGKQSKGQFERSTPVRQSQKDQFKIIKAKFDRIKKQIKKNDNPSEEQKAELLAQIQEIQNKLQEVSPTLKDKYKGAFDDYVNNCDELRKLVEPLSSIDSPPVTTPLPTSPIPTLQAPQAVSPVQGVSPIPTTPTPSHVEIELVQLSVDEVENEPATVEKKKKLKKKRNDTGNRKITLEEKSFEEIHKIRQEMETLRDEILVFKGHREDQVYHYLKESLLRLINKLQLIETYDHRQIKHERKAAIEHARDSISALDQIAAGGNISDIRKSLVKESDEEEEYLDTQGSESQDDLDENKVSIMDFKARLNSQLQRQTLGDRITMGLVKQQAHVDERESFQSAQNGGITETDDDDYTSSVEDILQMLESKGSTDNLAATLKVTAI